MRQGFEDVMDSGLKRLVFVKRIRFNKPSYSDDDDEHLLQDNPIKKEGNRPLDARVQHTIRLSETNSDFESINQYSNNCAGLDHVVVCEE